MIGSYTFLETKILSLNGTSSVAPQYYRVGQQLARRPRHSGSIITSYTHKRISANLTAYFRGADLDVEPRHEVRGAGRRCAQGRAAQQHREHLPGDGHRGEWKRDRDVRHQAGEQTEGEHQTGVTRQRPLGKPVPDQRG